MNATAARVQISERDDIQVVVHDDRQPERAVPEIGKPGVPSLYFKLGFFVSEKAAIESKHRLIAWLREIGVEVTP